MIKIRFFDPGLIYKTHKKEFDSEIQRVLSAGDLILRDDVERFEKRLARYCGTKYAVAVNSCTDALFLALKALKIGVGDEVLVPSRTFVATPQVIVQAGATPVFYDLDCKAKITEKTKAIIPVHIEGTFGANMKKLVKECKKYKVHIIEDAAQALGATQDGKKAGSFGIAGCFSFYPAKTLGCFGDGGGLVTNDKKLYEWVKGARNHFSKYVRSGEREFLPEWGFNSRMDNLQAAILNVKFKYYNKILARRKEIAKMYDKALKNINNLELPLHTPGRVWQDYIVRTTKRDELFTFLKEQGIETLKNNYPFPVPKLPQSQAYEDETLRLPCNEVLTNKEVNYVIKKIKEFYNKK